MLESAGMELAAPANRITLSFIELNREILRLMYCAESRKARLTWQMNVDQPISLIIDFPSKESLEAFIEHDEPNPAEVNTIELE
jgi:hypothetical protein